ncbi:MAG: 2-phospho-L-lactate transferase CofD family protein, partial [Candidatus Peribacteraceae bacterium]|nr:2-phospho-L-lactate transferase CofD family protein [Candidatus Peribacteraceae bacterium]
MQKIVLIGGGSGISPLLAELSKKKNLEVAAIVTVFDNGGSSGKLR